MKKITVENAVKLIAQSNGSLFSVRFTKKDGSERDMVARTGVSKGVKGVGMAYDPRELGLLTVFDINKGAHRLINLDTLKQITYSGKTYAVVQ